MKELDAMESGEKKPADDEREADDEKEKRERMLKRNYRALENQWKKR